MESNKVISLKAPINEIVEFNQFSEQLLKLEKDYGTRVYDLTDPIQEEAARSDRLKVAKTQSAFKKVRLAVKEKAQTIVNNTNKEGKIIDDRMEAVKQNIKGQLDKRDQELKEHAEKLQFRVDEIACLSIFSKSERDDGKYQIPFTPTSDQVNERLNILKNITVDDSFEDRKADATLLQIDIAKELYTLLIERVKFEDEQAELENLRKEKEQRELAEREDKIRKYAAESATREADEKASREKRIEKERVEGEKAVAAQKARIETENAVRIAEGKEREHLRNEQDKQRQELVKVHEAQAEKDKIKRENQEGAPIIIYLQAEDDGFVGDQITWSSDKINDTDIKYILYSKYAKSEDALLTEISLKIENKKS